MAAHVPIGATKTNEPRIKVLAAKLGVHRCWVVGGLCFLWGQHQLYGRGEFVPGLTPAEIDQESGIPGFAAALAEPKPEGLDWLRVVPGGVELPRIQEWIRSTEIERTRTYESERKRRQREKQKAAPKRPSSVRDSGGDSPGLPLRHQTSDIRHQTSGISADTPKPPERGAPQQPIDRPAGPPEPAVQAPTAATTAPPDRPEPPPEPQPPRRHAAPRAADPRTPRASGGVADLPTVPGAPPWPATSAGPSYDRSRAVLAAYPRQIGLQGGISAVRDALHLIAVRAGWLPANGSDHAAIDAAYDRAAVWLQARVQAYAASPLVESTPRDFIPAPAKWMADGRYDDDPAEWARRRVRDADKLSQRVAGHDENGVPFDYASLIRTDDQTNSSDAR